MLGADLAAEILVFKGLGKMAKVSRLDNVLKVDTGFRVSLSDWDSAKKFFKDHPDYPSATEFFKPKNGYKPYNSPTPQNWFTKGGTLELIEVADGALTFRYTNDIDGVPVSFDYVGGLPKLDGFVVNRRTDIQDIELTGNRSKDFELANLAAGYDKTPGGFTGHHDMPCGKMVLIPTSIHEMFGHQGGFSICR